MSGNRASWNIEESSGTSLAPTRTNLGVKFLDTNVVKSSYAPSHSDKVKVKVKVESNWTRRKMDHH